MIQKALFLLGLVVVLGLCVLGTVAKSSQITSTVATQSPQAATMAANAQVGVQDFSGLLFVGIVLLACYFLFRK